MRFNSNSLTKHEVSEQEVYEAFDNEPQGWYILDEADDAFMVVSFTHSSRLLEFGVRELEGGEIFIFHAQSASPEYRNKFVDEFGESRL